MGSEKRRLIGHLMRRAGFGSTTDELEKLEDLDYDRIVDDLRSRGVSLLSMQRHDLTLEEAFLKIVRETDT